MNGVNLWAGYYRCNPHRFCRDYLNIMLDTFQKILITMMFKSNYFIYLAARGAGKTWLTAVFCVAWCILYPNTKIVVASGVKNQAMLVMEKIRDELVPNSPNLNREISEIRLGLDNAYIKFKNGSMIRAVPATDNARGGRANILILDEYRLVDEGIYKGVLRRFLAGGRECGYHRKTKYKKIRERNKELFLSSAWFESHWSWDRFRDFFGKSLRDDKAYFACGIPYQMSVKCGRLSREQIIDETQEEGMDEATWAMEMECLPYGESKDAFFKFDTFNKVRKLKVPIYPKGLYEKLPRQNRVKYQNKGVGEIRLLSVDVAGMTRKHSDLTAMMLFRLIPISGGKYLREVSYVETLKGGHSGLQALRIRRLFEELDCDYIVLDTMGLGLGIYDYLVAPMTDEETGEEYTPITCVNDPEMAARCTDPRADAVIYSIKSSKKLNSEACVSLRNCLRTGKLRLLANEEDGEYLMQSTSWYQGLEVSDRVALMAPYAQTSELIREVVNLEITGSGDVIRKSGQRKDRYSAISYGNYIANELERKVVKNEKEYVTQAYYTKCRR